MVVYNIKTARNKASVMNSSVGLLGIGIFYSYRYYGSNKYAY